MLVRIWRKAMRCLPAILALLACGAVPLAGQGYGYVIKGRVLDEKGTPASGVHVCAFIVRFDPKKPYSFFPCGWSNARGEFTVVTRGPGRYTLHYSHEASGYFSSILPFFRGPSWRAPEVSLDEANPTRSVTVRMLPKNGLLVGRGVDDTTGLPVDKLEFVLCHADAPDVCWRKHARSAEGEFRIPGAFVPFTVRVKAEGYEDWLGPEGGEEAAPVSVAPGETLELTVRLRRSAGSAGRALSEAEKRPGVNLPAPAQTAPADGAFFDYYPRRTVLEWSPVEGAASYWPAQGPGGVRRPVPAPARDSGVQPAGLRHRRHLLRVHLHRRAARALARLGRGRAGARRFQEPLAAVHVPQVRGTRGGGRRSGGGLEECRLAAVRRRVGDA